VGGGGCTPPTTAQLLQGWQYHQRGYGWGASGDRSRGGGRGAGGVPSACHLHHCEELHSLKGRVHGMHVLLLRTVCWLDGGSAGSSAGPRATRLPSDCLGLFRAKARRRVQVTWSVRGLRGNNSAWPLPNRRHAEFNCDRGLCNCVQHRRKGLQIQKHAIEDRHVMRFC